MDDIMDSAALKSEKRRRDALKKRKADALSFEKAFCETFSTGQGQRVLLWLMEECGFLRPSCVINPTTLEINKESTAYNESRRDVYLRVRALLRSRPDILQNVEIYKLKGE